jgi:acetyl-CoA synthetase
MRRVLRKVIAQESDQLGDVSTLADPSVVERLVEKVDALIAEKSERAAKKARTQ